MQCIRICVWVFDERARWCFSNLQFFFLLLLFYPRNKRWANQQKLHTPCTTAVITHNRMQYNLDVFSFFFFVARICIVEKNMKLIKHYRMNMKKNRQLKIKSTHWFNIPGKRKNFTHSKIYSVYSHTKSTDKTKSQLFLFCLNQCSSDVNGANACFELKLPCNVVDQVNSGSRKKNTR